MPLPNGAGFDTLEALRFGRANGCGCYLDIKCVTASETPPPLILYQVADIPDLLRFQASPCVSLYIAACGPSLDQPALWTYSVTSSGSVTLSIAALDAALRQLDALYPTQIEVSSVRSVHKKVVIIRMPGPADTSNEERIRRLKAKAIAVSVANGTPLPNGAGFDTLESLRFGRAAYTAETASGPVTEPGCGCSDSGSGSRV